MTIVQPLDGGPGFPASRHGRPIPSALPAVWFLLLALAAAAWPLMGARSLGPESLLDSDPLYRVEAAPPKPLVPDPSRTVYDLPRDFAAAEGIRHGRFDLWNPRIGFGTPLWAEGGAPFLPLKLPFYLAPSRRTYDLATALRLLVAGLGAYLLARRRGLSRPSALAAGTVFELSGSMTTMMQFGSMAPPALLPWAVLGAVEIASARPWTGAAIAGVSLGIAGNSGHPMFVLVVFAGFGAAILGEVLAALRRPRDIPAICLAASLAGVLGLTISAPMILPLLELQHVGRQYKDILPYGQRMGMWFGYFRHILPVALFSPLMVVQMRPELRVALPFLLSPIIGSSGLILATAGLLRQRLGPALVAVALLGVAMTLAPPGLEWVRRIPMLIYVYPGYCWSLLALPLSQAAGDGAAALETWPARRAVPIAVGLVLAGSSSLFFLQDYGAADSPFALPVRHAFVATLADGPGWFALLLPPVLVSVLLLVLAVGGRSWPTGRRAIVASGLVAAELLAVLVPATWYADSQVLQSEPSLAVQFLQEQLAAGTHRMVGVQRDLGQPSATALFGLSDVRAVNALPVDRYVRYFEAMSPRVDWFFLQHPGLVRGHHPLLDLGAVRYVVNRTSEGGSDLLDGDAALRRVYRGFYATIYENSAALPRARIVHDGVRVAGPDEAFARLTEAARGGAHAAATELKDRIFIEPSADGIVPPVVNEAPTMGEFVVILQQDDPDEVHLQALVRRMGWVVLADTFYPGWTVTVDGVPTPIHPADLLFRAIVVSPGIHSIVFRYRPHAFVAGVALAIGGVIASILLFVGGRRAGETVLRVPG